MVQVLKMHRGINSVVSVGKRFDKKQPKKSKMWLPNCCNFMLSVKRVVEKKLALAKMIICNFVKVFHLKKPMTNCKPSMLS